MKYTGLIVNDRKSSDADKTKTSLQNEHFRLRLIVYRIYPGKADQPRLWGDIGGLVVVGHDGLHWRNVDDSTPTYTTGISFILEHCFNEMVMTV